MLVPVSRVARELCTELSPGGGGRVCVAVLAPKRRPCNLRRAIHMQTSYLLLLAQYLLVRPFTV